MGPGVCLWVWQLQTSQSIQTTDKMKAFCEAELCEVELRAHHWLETTTTVQHSHDDMKWTEQQSCTSQTSPNSYMTHLSLTSRHARVHDTAWPHTTVSVRWTLASTWHQSLIMVSWHFNTCCTMDQDSSGCQVICCRRCSGVEHAASIVVFGG